MQLGVVAIVLAAGRGVRLGGPKSLLLVRGPEGPAIPLIEAQCRDRLAHDCERALAVLRPDVAGLVTERLRAAGAEVVLSHAPDEEGPAGSLAAAANHLANKPFRAALVTPVDVRVAPSTVALLLEPLIEAHPEAHPEPLAVVPRFGSRRGHPVALSPEALARYREPSPPPLRDHLRSLGDRVLTLDVPDPFVLEDLDFAHQTDILLRIAGTTEPRFLA